MSLAVYSDDFNAYTLNQAPPSPWTPEPGNPGAVEIVSDPAAGGGQGRVVRVFDDDAGARSSLRFVFASAGLPNLSGVAFFEFKVRAAQTNKNLSIGLRDLNGVQFFTIIRLTHVGTIRRGDESSSAANDLASYAANTWYRIRLGFSGFVPTNQSLRFLYLDNSKIATNLEGGGTITNNLSEVFFRTFIEETGGVFFIDDFKVGGLFSTVKIGASRKKNGEPVSAGYAQIIRQVDNLSLGGGAALPDGSFTGNVQTETFDTQSYVVMLVGPNPGDGMSVRPSVEVT